MGLLLLIGLESLAAADASAARPSDGQPIQSVTNDWAFQSVSHPSGIPDVRDVHWSRNSIDRFVLAQLEAHTLQPSPEANRAVLIRRLSYDLSGLPPLPEEVERFVNDRSADAWEQVVDRLLASPRYGERWARHWLDVVHFGETHGYDKDKLRPHAWPYRDYVIRAFNADKPYSRFVEEQLAGDVLFPNDPGGVVATGFIAAGPWDYVGHVELPISKTDGLIARYNDRDDMVMTTMSTFLSFTAHCARCHDHKFDPIPQRDYYGLQAAFAGVDRANRPYDDDPVVHRERRRLRAEQRQLEAMLTPPTAGGVTDPAQAALTNRLEALKSELSRLPEPKWVYAAANDFKPEGSFVPAKGVRPVHLLARGEVKRPLEEMRPAALRMIEGLPHEFALPEDHVEGDRRAALARWLTDPRNLQSRRSIVNRVWQYHFGRGIVETSNDFGRMGSPPTHPELLDWLAFWFRENGESLKKLHRLIVTSATYRQASANRPECETIDADNRYLWRMNRARLDAECIRDAILAVSGQLDLTMGGPSDRQFLFKDDHSPVYDYTRFEVDSPAARRRSVYRFIVRSVTDPFMDCLDAADPAQLVARRNTTLTALQALATLNNPLVLRQCEHFAARLRSVSADPGRQIDNAFRLALSRDPTTEERRTFAEYSHQHGLANACRVLVNTTEFMFVD